MEKEFIIELPDGASLPRLCGTNDRNLKLIESFLGVPVYTRGNLLSVEDGRPEVRQKFKFIIDRLLDEISDGSPCGEDLVRAVLNVSVPSQGGAAFSASSLAVVIPGGTRKVYPRTAGQAALLDAMRRFDVVFASGPAGSGKTFLAVAEALSLLLSRRVNSLVLTRPVVEAGESLGFLPGTLEEKIHPYLRPLLDSVGACLPKESVHRLTEGGLVEVAPLAYMRGRTLSNCAVILDEAQNATAEQMKMLLTRLGEGAKLFVTGDGTQCDLPGRRESGLLHALRVLKGVEGIGVVRLSSDDVVRSELVRRIVAAYERFESGEGERAEMPRRPAPPPQRETRRGEPWGPPPFRPTGGIRLV